MAHLVTMSFAVHVGTHANYHASSYHTPPHSPRGNSGYSRAPMTSKEKNSFTHQIADHVVSVFKKDGMRGPEFKAWIRNVKGDKVLDDAVKKAIVERTEARRGDEEGYYKEIGRLGALIPSVKKNVIEYITSGNLLVGAGEDLHKQRRNKRRDYQDNNAESKSKKGKKSLFEKENTKTSNNITLEG